MTVRDWIRRAQERLRLASRPDAELEVRLFVAGIKGIGPSGVYAVMDKNLTTDEENELEIRLAKREQGEPFQYIEGIAYFMGLTFFVDERVLIPRQDTETLAEEAINIIRKKPNASVLDLCTGSGALAVTIAHYVKDASVSASDISEGALEVAKANAENNQVNVQFFHGDGFSPLTGKTFDVIVSNPPYLTKSDMEGLQEEVRHEPELALFGGDDGLELYRKFACQLPLFLAPNGYALFEVGQGQAEEVRKLLLEKADYPQSGIIKDLCGIDRVVWIRSRG